MTYQKQCLHPKNDILDNEASKVKATIHEHCRVQLVLLQTFATNGPYLKSLLAIE